MSAVCNQASLFLIIIAISRVLGSRAVGEYTLGWASLSVLGLFALWGFQATLIRFVAVHLADRDPARVRGVILVGVLGPVALSTVMATLLFIFAAPIARIFEQGSLTTILQLAALTLPAATIRDAALAATQGWRSQRAYALIGWVFEPLLRLALTGAVLALGGKMSARPSPPSRSRRGAPRCWLCSAWCAAYERCRGPDRSSNLGPFCGSPRSVGASSSAR